MHTEQIINRLREKSEKINSRAPLVERLRSIPRFANLRVGELAEFFALVKARRWQIHHAAGRHNIAVQHRRRGGARGEGQPDNELRRWTASSNMTLTISRAALGLHATGKLICAATIQEELGDLHISRNLIYDYLRTGEQMGMLRQVEVDAGPKSYTLTQKAEDLYLDNLLSNVFNPVTYEYVETMHEVYEALKFTAGRPNSDLRSGDETVLQKAIRLSVVSDN